MQNYSVNYNDAYGYAGWYGESSYYCGAGHDLLKQYFTCMLGITNSNSTDGCFAQAIGDFQNGKICKGYNDMTYCYSDVYIKTCGAGISPLICNMLQKDFQGQDGSWVCNWFDCSKPYPYNGTAF
uniref:Uncharacterized protein n=1 Tax=Panagrolaimus sp. JU765 TaxID=591449 RepID=A0AC34RHI6_9BILA